MNAWIKRALGGLLTAAGAVLLIRHGAKLLDWPHLYPDLGQLGLRNLLFGGLFLLALAGAWISAAYLLLNTEKGIVHFLIPAAAFVLLLTGSGLCLTETVGEIPCSYTDSLASCREELDGLSYLVRGLSLYPVTPTGELSAYARYEKGETLAESVTRSYSQDEFSYEALRLSALGLASFRPPQDPRERECVCYELVLGDTLWQVLVTPKDKTVTYSRFNRPDQLPAFAPQPALPAAAAGA